MRVSGNDLSWRGGNGAAWNAAAVPFPEPVQNFLEEN